jgi:hypothetical protein
VICICEKEYDISAESSTECAHLIPNESLVTFFFDAFPVFTRKHEHQPYRIRNLGLESPNPEIQNPSLTLSAIQNSDSEPLRPSASVPIIQHPFALRTSQSSATFLQSDIIADHSDGHHRSLFDKM